MSLTPGVRLGAYEVVAPLGAGGMGEVYRARDTRLDRDVAIKALPDEFASDHPRTDRIEFTEPRLILPVSWTASYQAHGGGDRYAVSPDAQRFLVVTDAEERPAHSMTLVVNWTALLDAPDRRP